MAFDPIVKTDAERASATVPDIASARRDFSWQSVRDDLLGDPTRNAETVNIADLAVDRHVAAGHGDQVAIRWLGRDGARRDIGYAALADDAARFANLLAAREIVRGDRLFVMAGRVPELYAAVLGALKAGIAVTPLFAAFGPEPIRSRMEIGEANVLLCTAAQYLRKIAEWRHELPSLRLVLILGEDAPEGCVALGPAMAEASTGFATVATGPEDIALIHFTSGTTGKPKGAVHVHDAVVAHAETGRIALDLHPGDIQDFRNQSIVLGHRQKTVVGGQVKVTCLGNR